MNERIKQLAKQVDACYIPRYDMWQMDTETMEKFAELIVRECRDIVDATRDQAIEDGWNVDEAMSTAMFDIEDHFGVEEQQKVAPKPKCSVCGTTENVKYMGGYQPYLCDSEDCIPF